MSVEVIDTPLVVSLALSVDNKRLRSYFHAQTLGDLLVMVQDDRCRDFEFRSMLLSGFDIGIHVGVQQVKLNPLRLEVLGELGESGLVIVCDGTIRRSPPRKPSVSI